MYLAKFNLFLFRYNLNSYLQVGPKPTIKDLLMCVLNSQDVEAMIQIPGRRYLADDGTEVAAMEIQRYEDYKLFLSHILE